MSVPIFQVDAFTGRSFAGNPAGVCLLDAPRSDAWLRAVAGEMNLSETAFVVREAGEWSLRWFTPVVEVELCGHATLASAHVLWEQGIVPTGESARFRTLSGTLTAARRGEWIDLDFPATPSTPAPAPDGLAAALGVTPLHVGRSVFDVLVEVADESAVRALEPDLALLRRIDARGVIVTSRATSPGFDFVSRFFGPVVGVDEDPVTGSAHCCLAPYWAERLGKTAMLGHQASARGGEIAVRLSGDRVIISGRAVTVLRGELTDAAVDADVATRDARALAAVASSGGATA